MTLNFLFSDDLILMSTPPMTKDSRLTLRSSRTPEPDDVTTGVNRDTDVDKMFALSPQAADEVTTFLFTQYLTVLTYSIVTSTIQTTRIC